MMKCVCHDVCSSLDCFQLEDDSSQFRMNSTFDWKFLTPLTRSNGCLAKVVADDFHAWHCVNTYLSASDQQKEKHMFTADPLHLKQ